MEKNKIIAVAVVVIVVVVAAAAAVMLTQNGDDEKINGFNIIGRVNTEGSGIYLAAGEDPSNYVSTDLTADNVITVGKVGLIKDGWAGKVIADPGNATIQHVQLGDIAAALGLGFKPYVNGEEISMDNLYYQTGVASYAAFEAACITNPHLVGAFIWEAQLAIAEVSGCSVVAITNDLFPQHACCIIGASQSYMAQNRDVTVRFLAAYIESVNQLNEAIGDKGTDAYKDAMTIAKEYLKGSMQDLSDAEKEEAISAAWERVTYVAADDASGSLSKLTSEVAELADALYKGNSVQKSASDLGFKSFSALADSFVDDSYMIDASKYDLANEDNSKAKITIAVIGGDIHQFAIHYGLANGIFSDYGIDIVLSEQTAGPGVYTALSNGNAQFGFLGAPPMTINSINSETVGSHN